MRCLRQILQVKWQDHIPDTEVLQRSKSMSIGSMLMESQLRWSGHIARMPDYRLPKRVFFGELCSGNRSRGRPRKRYKDTLKVALKRCLIKPSTWGVCAQDRGQSFPTQIWSLLVVLQVFYQVVLESNNVVLCRVSLKTTMFVLIDAAL